MNSTLKSSDSLWRVTHHAPFRISKRSGLDKVSACHDHSPQNIRSATSVQFSSYIPGNECIYINLVYSSHPWKKKTNFPDLPSRVIGGSKEGILLFHTCKTYIIPNNDFKDAPKNGVVFSFIGLEMAPFATLSQLSCGWKSKACFIRIQWSEIHGDMWRSLAVKWSTSAWGGPSDNDRLLGRLRCKLSTEKFFQISKDTETACHFKEVPLKKNSKKAIWRP